MATQQGNSFFVEHDCCYSRIDAKDAVRLIARQRQEMITCELSRLDGEVYLADMMQHLRQLEVCIQNIDLRVILANMPADNWL